MVAMMGKSHGELRIATSGAENWSHLQKSSKDT
jgi:hypothetical protein